MIKDELFEKLKNLMTIQQHLMVNAQNNYDAGSIKLKNDEFVSLYGFSVSEDGELMMYSKVKIPSMVATYTKVVNVFDEVVNPEPLIELYTFVLDIAEEGNKVLENIRKKYIGKRIKMDDEADIAFTIHSVKVLGSVIHFVDAEEIDSVNPELCTLYDQN